MRLLGVRPWAAQRRACSGRTRVSRRLLKGASVAPRGAPLTRGVIRTRFKWQSMSVETATPLELTTFTAFLLLVAAAVWWFIGFWGRMWSESIQSRSVDR